MSSQNESLSPYQRLGTIAAIASLATLSGFAAPESGSDNSQPLPTNEQTPYQKLLDDGQHPTTETSQVHPKPKQEAKPLVTPSDIFVHAIDTKSIVAVHQQPKQAPNHSIIAPKPVIEPPHPVITLKPGPTKGVEQPIKELNLSSLTIPEGVAQTMRRDVAYLPAFGCSGSLLRDPAGTAIGVITAEHCSLRGRGSNSTVRQTGSDGKSYIVIKGGVEVDTGDNLKQLVPSGEVTTFITPSTDDTTHDLVIGAFAGHTTDEVLQNYNANRLSDTELSALKTGDAAFLSGWPIAQPKNSGALERQSFPMAIIGRGTTTTTLGETLDVTWTAVAADKDGAMCSFGDSGGEGFVEQAGKPRSMGVLSAFYDFTGTTFRTLAQGEAARASFEASYNVDLSGAVAVCGFANEIPTDKDYQELQVVSQNSDIPGYTEFHSPEGQLSRARSEFFDPTYPKQILDGILGVPIDSNGTIAWKQRPALFYDPETFSVVVASYNPNSPDNLELDYITNMYDLTAYSSYDQLGLSMPIVTIDGAIASQDTQAYFVDSNGFNFGNSLAAGTTPDLSAPYTISYNYQTQTLLTYVVSQTTDGMK